MFQKSLILNVNATALINRLHYTKWYAYHIMHHDVCECLVFGGCGYIWEGAAI